MERPVDHELALRNVACQIRNWMGPVISRHSQDWHLSNRALRPMQSTCSLVDGSKVRVHVARVASSSWDLFSCCRDLPQRFSVVRHVRKNDEHVISLLDRKVFGSCESQPRRKYTLDSRVVSQVDEHGHVVEGALLLKIVPKESELIGRNSHSGKNCRKRLV